MRAIPSKPARRTDLGRSADQYLETSFLGSSAARCVRHDDCLSNNDPAFYFDEDQFKCVPCSYDEVRSVWERCGAARRCLHSHRTAVAQARCRALNDEAADRLTGRHSCLFGNWAVRNNGTCECNPGFDMVR